MNLDSFWKIIEDSRLGGADCYQQAERLETLLSGLTADEIIAFDRLFKERSADAYTYGLWGVAYLVNGGCSDDGFQYFRWWLIGQGRERYEAALDDPESIADYASQGECESEDIAYAIIQAYENVTGEFMPANYVPVPSKPSGTSWDEDDVALRFPKVAARFFQ